MILVRKRPDGVFERLFADGRLELFTLPEMDGEEADDPPNQGIAAFGRSGPEEPFD